MSIRRFIANIRLNAKLRQRRIARTVHGSRVQQGISEAQRRRWRNDPLRRQA